MSPRTRAFAAYRAAFGGHPSQLIYAPGRVNLIGEHTDYNDGFVFPCAIDRGTAVAVGSAPSGMIEVVSADYDETDRFDPAAPFDATPGWRIYVRAVAAVFRARGIAIGGLRIAIAGDVPQGAGLSSSASLGVALGGVIRDTLSALDGGSVLVGGLELRIAPLEPRLIGRIGERVGVCGSDALLRIFIETVSTRRSSLENSQETTKVRPSADQSAWLTPSQVAGVLLITFIVCASRKTI
jgi:hypothetical protein